MDSFEFNKIVAGVLVSLLVIMVGRMTSEYLVHPRMLSKNAYQIEVPESFQSAAGPKIKREIEPIAPFLQNANFERGKEIVTKKCAQCHTFEEGGRQKIGPNLWGVVGNACARVASFAYSATLQKLKVTWNYEELSEFLMKPRKFAPGTKMSFAGLKKPEDRAAVILYLRTLNNNPPPLPEA